MKSKTLIDALHFVVREYPHHGIGYVQPDGNVIRESYPELHNHALQLLYSMQARGFKQGDRVILSLNSAADSIPVLWACFLGGIIPALLQPPVSFSEYNPAAEKAEKVFRVLDDPWIILSQVHHETWMKSGIPSNLLIDVEWLKEIKGEPLLPEIRATDLAMIQFSSGSTGDPKGIMLSHSNLMTNTQDISHGLKKTPYDITSSWMPLYHDMGLIGFHLTPLIACGTHYLIEPVDFIKNPGLWLDTLTKMRTTITGCPNFGQVLVNRFVQRKQNENWDLSSVRTVFNGAEPISVPAMREFLDLLAPFGLRPESMFPAYGMAEATLAITFASLEDEPTVKSFCRTKLLRDGVIDERTEGEPDSMELVSLGKSLRSCAIRITDLNGLPIGEDKVGIVEVKGDNVTSGYYNAPEATLEALSHGWLRTGDLGFIHEGDLFIMGRAKDVIFISGTNYYASDLEHVALQMKEIAMGRIVMAGYFDEKEGHDKVLVFLVSPDNQATRDLFKKIQQHFQHTIGLFIDTFIPIRSNEIPRTSSGKIQRYKMVSRFLNDEYPAVIRI